MQGSNADERLTVIQEELSAAVGRMLDSDDWRAALVAAARFHKYSFDNVLLIYAQHSAAFSANRVTAAEPSMVAGYRQWQAMGRQVAAGQRGYTIMRPNRLQWRETKDPGSGDWRRLNRGEHINPGATERQRSRLHPGRPFGLATVFDVSQTEGEPIPEPPAPLILAGKAPSGLWEGLATQIAGNSFVLKDAASAANIAGANGVTDWNDLTVTIRADMDDSARAKTLTHELGHVLMHDPRSPDGSINVAAVRAITRGAKEVEAESVAFLVGAAHGMDTADYSLPYISTWASRDQGLATVRQVGTRVVTTTRRILDDLPTTQWGTGQPPGLPERLAQQKRQHHSRYSERQPSNAHTAAAGVGR